MNAVLARYMGFRSVGSRGVVALIFDVDEARTSDALNLLGPITPGQDTHIAMVRLGSDPENTEAVAYGTYAAKRTVAARKALSLTIEIPAEREWSTNQKLGTPTTTTPIDVVLAVLSEEPVIKEPTKTQARDHRKWAVQQCGMRCRDAEFQRFLLGPAWMEGAPQAMADMATVEVYLRLGINSRTQIGTDDEKLAEWNALYRRYQEHIQGGRLPGEA